MMSRLRFYSYYTVLCGMNEYFCVCMYVCIWSFHFVYSKMFLTEVYI